MYYIYQRVSCDKQSLIRQEGIIGEYCQANNIKVADENIFSDVITGKTIKRENYQKMKSLLQKDDILIIHSLDRLGRNWDLIKKEWEELTQKGIYIIVIDCPLINVLPDNKGQVSIDRRLIQEMMFTLLCYVSQKEVEKVSTRTRDAIRAKREADPNFKIGREKTYADDIRHQVIAHYNSGHTMQECAEKFGVSTSSVHRFVNESKKEKKK